MTKPKQLNWEAIEKEFDDIFCVETKEEGQILADRKTVKTFLKAKINEVMDEMIGEPVIHRKPHIKESKSEFNKNRGYNKKVNELKDFKRKFNS